MRQSRSVAERARRIIITDFRCSCCTRGTLNRTRTTIFIQTNSSVTICYCLSIVTGPILWTFCHTLLFFFIKRIRSTRTIITIDAFLACIISSWQVPTWFTFNNTTASKTGTFAFIITFVTFPKTAFLRCIHVRIACRTLHFQMRMRWQFSFTPHSRIIRGITQYSITRFMICRRIFAITPTNKIQCRITRWITTSSTKYIIIYTQHKITITIYIIKIFHSMATIYTFTHNLTRIVCSRWICKTGGCRRTRATSSPACKRISI